MNDKHDIYLQGGEINYIGRVDSAKILAGNQRFKLKYWITDPRAKVLKIYWSQKKDSVIVPIATHLPKDSIELIIGDALKIIPQNNYTIQLVSTDGGSLKSIVFEKIGNVYGSKFLATLSNRLYTLVKYTVAGSEVAITWAGITSDKEIGLEFSYVDMNNLPVKTKLSTMALGAVTTLKNVNKPLGITYRTMFLPEKMAIDTFYTSSRTVVIP
jgi:hypothetical protein